MTIQIWAEWTATDGYSTLLTADMPFPALFSLLGAGLKKNH